MQAVLNMFVTSRESVGSSGERFQRGFIDGLTPLTRAHFPARLTRSAPAKADFATFPRRIHSLGMGAARLPSTSAGALPLP
jgi:hypothetical protein